MELRQMLFQESKLAPSPSSRNAAASSKLIIKFFIWILHSSFFTYDLWCSPHSLCSGDSHHHLPARMSSPGWMALVQGWQPMLG